MKLSASTPEERKRQFLLLGLLAVAIAYVVYRQMGGVSADGALAPMPEACACARSFGAGFSWAMANFTAASTAAASIPACAGVRRCQSKRYGRCFGRDPLALR